MQLRDCFALTYMPRQWLKTKVIFIPILGRKPYTEVKDFSPISLTSFLLERLIDVYLKVGHLKFWPLQEKQHANHMGRPLETALLSVVGFIEDRIEHQEVCAGTFLDLAGALSRSSRRGIFGTLYF